MNTAIIAIARNENDYLDEWIQYYRHLGFNHIYLWDNNDVDDLSVYSITNKYDFVTILDARGRTKLEQLGRQRGCYQQTYNQIKNEYDWVGIFDIDEFLFVPDTIENFVTQPVFNDTSCIHLNWRYYGDNDLVLYDPRPVQERFIEPCPDNVKYALREHENGWVKSLIRGRLPNCQILVHSAITPNMKCRHANGKLCDGSLEYIDYIDFSCGYVKHYGTKTIDEYIKRKCLSPLNACDTLRISGATRLNWFFNVNRHTPPKDAIAQFIYQRGI